MLCVCIEQTKSKTWRRVRKIRKSFKRHHNKSLILSPASIIFHDDKTVYTSPTLCGFYMEFLYSIDRAVFLFLNRTVANRVFDFLMPIITEKDYWMIPIVLALLSLIIFGGKKGRIVVLLVAVILTMSDQLSSHVVKPWVERVRPCFVVEGVRLLIRQSRSFSFPSSHASNMAAMATLFSVKYPRYKIAFIVFAALVAYSRIYVGVHYPADILGGAVLGFLCAVCVLEIERWIRRLWQKRKTSEETKESTEGEPSGPTGGGD